MWYDKYTICSYECYTFPYIAKPWGGGGCLSNSPSQWFWKTLREPYLDKCISENDLDQFIRILPTRCIFWAMMRRRLIHEVWTTKPLGILGLHHDIERTMGQKQNHWLEGGGWRMRMRHESTFRAIEISVWLQRPIEMFCSQTQQWPYFDTCTLPEAWALRIRSFCPRPDFWAANAPLEQSSGTNKWYHWSQYKTFSIAHSGKYAHAYWNISLASTPYEYIFYIFI